MDEICIRFPHIGEKILYLLDYQTLHNLKDASRIICRLVNNTKPFWVKSIQRRFQSSDESPEAWKRILLRVSQKEW